MTTEFSGIKVGNAVQLIFQYHFGTNFFYYLEQRNLDNVAVERIILKCKAAYRLEHSVTA